MQVGEEQDPVKLNNTWTQLFCALRIYHHWEQLLKGQRRKGIDLDLPISFPPALLMQIQENAPDSPFSCGLWSQVHSSQTGNVPISPPTLYHARASMPRWLRTLTCKPTQMLMNTQMCTQLPMQICVHTPRFAQLLCAKYVNTPADTQPPQILHPHAAAPPTPGPGCS